MTDEVDIIENKLLSEHPDVLRQLLLDQTTHENIFWATDSYAHLGEGYQWGDAITPERITGEHGMVLQPRAVKSREEQTRRSKDMAEVFTPSWVCNAQNNLVDEAWFGRPDVFNHENPDHTWTPTPGPIAFPEGKTWKDYVRAPRLEVSCGEAPYLASRYDVVSGKPIPIMKRVGILDRKLRVVNENTPAEPTKNNVHIWRRYALEALQAVYGFDWQGDNVLLAREALMKTYLDYYKAKWGKEPRPAALINPALVVSWNIWQMDGLKLVIPNSCGWSKMYPGQPETCNGCKHNNIHQHNGIYCKIIEWQSAEPPRGEEIQFLKLLKK